MSSPIGTADLFAPPVQSSPRDSRTLLPPDPSAKALGYYQALFSERIFIEVPMYVFKLTTANENTGGQDS